MTKSTSSPGIVRPPTLRPRLLFEALSEMMAYNDWPYRAPLLELRSQGDEKGVFRLYGANHPDTIREVAERKLDISMLNPAALLTMAHRGVGPFEKPLPVAVITVMPHYDQLGFAAAQRAGITSLEAPALPLWNRSGRSSVRCECPPEVHATHRPAFWSTWC
jgi:hypothetical protein